jgi:hypothetical protein
VKDDAGVFEEVLIPSMLLRALAAKTAYSDSPTRCFKDHSRAVGPEVCCAANFASGATRAADGNNPVSRAVERFAKQDVSGPAARRVMSGI